MAFDSSGAKAVWAARLGTTPKRCELQLFLAGIRQAVRRQKAIHLGRLNMQFQQDWPKDKNYSSFNFLAENLEKFRLTELYGAPLERSTIFLCHSSSGCTSMESCQLADLKYAIFSSSGCKTKKLPPSKLFLSMVCSMGSKRDQHQNWCEVWFFLEGETHASQIWPALRKSYTISTLSKSP